MKKFLAAVLLSVGLGAAGSASAIVVGGIDFGNTGLTSHFESTTLAETVVLAEGQKIEGYGIIERVNGDGTYCAIAGQSNCALFFYFHDYTVIDFSPTHVEFSGGIIDIYYDPGTGGADTGKTRNFFDFTSPQNVAYITSLSEWVQLMGHVLNGCTEVGATLCADGTLTGDSITFSGTGLLDVVLGAFGLASVQNYWNPSNHPDGLGGFADIVLSSSGNTNRPNPLDVCSDTPQAGEWCIQGTAEISGDVVIPEPSTLLLLAFGLAGLGFGASRRTKRHA